jgi:galactonate dehydratase
MVRSFCFGWYGEMVAELPAHANGHLTPPAGPGLGIALRSGICKRSDVKVRWSRLG